ncbi:MAG TPA: hypothetical protein VJ781_08110 [Pyrinomonadaceae bacterium]|jgi:threonine/homoserine/homoserine lactone efflux protein|nr:hypothetical protein [Pyrinomonadaceae bacterium]
MKLFYILLGLCGVYFLASAATEEGLLPSGHGTGRWSEIILGLAFVGFAIYRLWKK